MAKMKIFELLLAAAAALIAAAKAMIKFIVNVGKTQPQPAAG